MVISLCSLASQSTNGGPWHPWESAEVLGTIPHWDSTSPRLGQGPSATETGTSYAHSPCYNPSSKSPQYLVQLSGRCMGNSSADDHGLAARLPGRSSQSHPLLWLSSHVRDLCSSRSHELVLLLGTYLIDHLSAITKPS
jgi:hypothetical protein